VGQGPRPAEEAEVTDPGCQTCRVWAGTVSLIRGQGRVSGMLTPWQPDRRKGSRVDRWTQLRTEELSFFLLPWVPGSHEHMLVFSLTLSRGLQPMAEPLSLGCSHGSLSVTSRRSLTKESCEGGLLTWLS
jgi:hypothetical protein